MTNYEALINLMKQGINIFNISDEFYNNLCYDYLFETEKDVAFKDRIKVFYPNISLCDSGCIQTGVNLENMTSICECKFNDISNKTNSIKDNIIINELLGDYIDIFESSNIKVLKCAKIAIKYFKKYYGMYITISFFGISIICVIIFYIFQFSNLKIYIFSHTQNYLNLIGGGNFIINSQPPPKHKKSDKKLIKEDKKEERHISKKNVMKEDLKEEENYISNINIKRNRKNKTQMHNNMFKNLNLLNKDQNSKSNSNEKFLISKRNKKKAKTEFKTIETNANLKINAHNDRNKKYFEEYFSLSPEDMEYDDAIKLDHRKFCQYFRDNLMENQIILNTFCEKEPLKPLTIKIIIFILNILLFFVINGLFINDDYISEVYYLEKKDNFFSFIPRSIGRFVYTTFVGIIIEFIIGFFFVEEKKLKGIFLRERNNRIKLQNEIINFLKTIKYRILGFFIFSFLIYIGCLYYLICFNSIYPKIQKEWVKSSIFLILLRQIISVLQCLLETIFRFISFKCESERLFKVSKLVN